MRIQGAVAPVELRLDAGDLGGATAEYERIIGRNSKDKRTRTMLKQLYGRLGRTEQLLALEASEK